MAESTRLLSFMNESDYYSSEESDDSNNSSRKSTAGRNQTIKLTKKQKCTTRNAILARQNRIRKKMYVENLENEIRKLRSSRDKLNSLVDNQSFTISELRKEVNYMKSVLANSSDLSNLIKNISSSTGMSVTTSLDKSLTNNKCVSKQGNSHPWDDYISLPESLELGLPDLDLDVDLPDFKFENFTESFPSQGNTSNTTLQEHNYTSKTDYTEDSGVCLHVSKHKVSLEFCTSCNDNAAQAWKESE